MAATGKTPILLYGSTTASNVPVAGNLTNSSDGCEIAINVADKNLFFKDSTNAVNTVPIRQSSASSNGWLSSTDWSTFNGKQPAGSYALTTGTLAQFASTTSAQLASVISDETGSGVLVFGTSPTIATPTLTGNVTLSTGNLVIGTSGKGIDFSATAGTGTSELLNDYEEGTWTPVDSSGAGLTLTVDSALYTKVGRQVFVQARITYPSTASGSTSLIGGLPYTSGASSRVGLSLGYNNLTADYVPFVSAGSALVEMYVTASGGSQTTNANLSTKTFAFSGSYTV